MNLRQLPELLDALRALSPMPSDEELEAHPEEGAQLLDTYVEIIEAIRNAIVVDYPPEIVTSLLASFGVGDGGESYWTVLHLIEAFPRKDLLHSLIQQASENPNPGTRLWSCIMLGRWRSLDDVPLFLKRLKDAVPAVRQAALQDGIATLAQKYTLPYAVPSVAELLNDEHEAVRRAAKRVLAALQAQE